MTLNNLQPSDGGVYGVIVSSAYGAVASSNVLLTVVPVPPAITTQPTNQAVYAGGAVTFTVAATGPGPLYYQWQFGVNGTNIVGATNATLNLINVQPTNGGVYAVNVSNASGATVSSNALLTVLVLPPTITTQPAPQTVYPGAW